MGTTYVRHHCATAASLSPDSPQLAAPPPPRCPPCRRGGHSVSVASRRASQPPSPVTHVTRASLELDSPINHGEMQLHFPRSGNLSNRCKELGHNRLERGVQGNGRLGQLRCGGGTSRRSTHSLTRHFVVGSECVCFCHGAPAFEKRTPSASATKVVLSMVMKVALTLGASRTVATR
jgi:hypothetical protein